MTEEESKYISFVNKITQELSGENSFQKKQHEQIRKIFDDFRFTSEEMAQVLAQTIVAETQYINQFAIQASMQLMAEKREEDKASKELQLANEKISLAQKELQKVDKEIELLSKQIEQATKQTSLIEEQKKLIVRQSEGYDDNIITKAAEFEGGLASFAVNADSTSAQSAIDNFVNTINELKNRTN